jgi:hypothetical protein
VEENAEITNLMLPLVGGVSSLSSASARESEGKGEIAGKVLSENWQVLPTLLVSD